MKLKNIFKSLLLAILLAATVIGCDYDKDLIEELEVEREFAPVNLTSQVRNQVNVELNWTVDENVNSYIVEVSNDSTSFDNIVKTIEVNSEELPVVIPLESETFYSIRVKAVSDRGRDDSTWATIRTRTLTEQIFTEEQPGDKGAKEATFRWAPNSEVTEIEISPGNITYTITPEDKISGVATVTGLSPETEYTATLLNGNRIRGVQQFTTGIDIGDGKLVTVEDDLLQMIIDAAPGDILVLEAGDYTEQTGSITLDKSITIRGLRSYDKPLLNVNFEIVGGANDVEIIDLDLKGNGQGSETLTDFIRYTGAGNFNSLVINGCVVHDYGRSFVAGNETDAILQNLTIENSIVYNVFTGGGDFIDFRNSDVLNVTLQTSTFYNCAFGRDFLRLDDAGSSTQTGLTQNVVIDHCTIYACSTGGKRILYVRFQNNEIVVENTIIAETDGYYSDQSRTDPDVDFSNNNYWNAPGFYDETKTIYDDSSSYFTLDPGFVDPSSGNFTVTNQTLLDNNIGDPRWR